jgi:hypothetical protein
VRSPGRYLVKTPCFGSCQSTARRPDLLLIAHLIDTNRSRGAEVGLPPRFAGRIPHEGTVTLCLAGRGACRHATGMFIVTEADAAAIRAVFDQDGELSAAIELRRRFPGITDNAKARAHARSIAGWTPLPVQPRPVTRLRPRKDS